MTQRLKISMTDEMYEALEKLASERQQPRAYLVREAVALYLERSGRIKVYDVHPAWGGKRDGEDD